MSFVTEFEIVGDPSPQGSKTRMPNGAVVEGRSAAQRAKHKNWRTAIADAAKDVAERLPEFDGYDAPLDGPLGLSVEFRFAMPASRRKAVREAGRAFKTSAPDVDKLLRALCDGLQAGGLIRDDARICAVEATKVEVVGWTGALVTITREEHP